MTPLGVVLLILLVVAALLAVLSIIQHPPMTERLLATAVFILAVEIIIRSLT
jgi:hypothetical protein